MDWNEHDDFAYILDVDLEYPKEIQDEQSDYPLAPENMKVEEKLLSKHQRELHRHYYNGKEAKDEKQPKLTGSADLWLQLSMIRDDSCHRRPRGTARNYPMQIYSQQLPFLGENMGKTAQHVMGTHNVCNTA